MSEKDSLISLSDELKKLAEYGNDISNYQGEAGENEFISKYCTMFIDYADEVFDEISGYARDYYAAEYPADRQRIKDEVIDIYGTDIFACIENNDPDRLKRIIYSSYKVDVFNAMHDLAEGLEILDQKIKNENLLALIEGGVTDNEIVNIGFASNILQLRDAMQYIINDFDAIPHNDGIIKVVDKCKSMINEYISFHGELYSERSLPKRKSVNNEKAITIFWKVIMSVAFFVGTVAVATIIDLFLFRFSAALGEFLGLLMIIPAIIVGGNVADKRIYKIEQRKNKEIDAQIERIKSENDRKKKEYFDNFIDGLRFEVLAYLAANADDLVVLCVNIYEKCVNILNSDEMWFLPLAYRYDSKAILTMFGYFKDHRAYNIKEAVNLYISEKTEDERAQEIARLQNERSEMLKDIERYKSERDFALNRLNEGNTSALSDIGFELGVSIIRKAQIKEAKKIAENVDTLNKTIESGKEELKRTREEIERLQKSLNN